MAAKGYFDALVKLGELASDSQGSKELGERTYEPKLTPQLGGGRSPNGLSHVRAREGDEGERNEEMEREKERGKAREWGYCWEINNTT